MSAITNLPLVNDSHVQSAQMDLTALSHAAAAFRAGKMPTSDQLATIVQKVLKSSVLQPDLGSRLGRKAGGGKLSGPGREVVVRMREVLQAALRLGLEKNDDDKIQRFLYLASEADVDIEGNIETPDIPLPSSQEIAEAKASLKNLCTVLLTSSQLRSVFGDLVNLARDLFADSAEGVAQAAISTTKASKKVAKEARPSEEERKEGKTGLEGKELPNARDVKKQAVRAAEDAKDNAQDAVNKKVKQAKSYIDEALPTDAKDAAIEKFKAIVNEVQESPDYKDAVDTLVSLTRKYATLATDSVKEAAEASNVTGSVNQEAETAGFLFRSIIESFTGPLDDVFRTADKVIKDLEGDERIQALLDDAEKLLDRAINDPGYATSSKAQRKAEEIYDRAQDLIKSNATWKQDTHSLLSELKAALDKAANDKALNEFGLSIERLGAASKKFGSKGFSLASGSDLLNDFSTVMLPRVLGVLKTIPLPRVEYTSEDFDFAVDNVRFTSQSFIPDMSHFTTHAEVVSRKGYAAYATSVSSKTTLSVGGLRLQARDLSYYFHKKTGWIGLEDSGLLDIIIGSETEDAEDGLDITLTVENATEEDRATFFKLTKVECAVQNFQLRIHDSQHPIRNWFARPAVQGYVEQQFVTALEEQIGVLFKELDSSFYDLQQRSIGAGRAAPNPAAYLQAMFAPSGSSSGVEVKETGITKVGAKGEYILAIGVEEELLPGKLTGLGNQGTDVVTRKRTLEGLAEEGRSTYNETAEQATEVREELGDEADRVAEQYNEAKRREMRRDGWKSKAFDL